MQNENEINRTKPKHHLPEVSNAVDEEEAESGDLTPNDVDQELLKVVVIFFQFTSICHFRKSDKVLKASASIVSFKNLKLCGNRVALRSITNLANGRPAVSKSVGNPMGPKSDSSNVGSPWMELSRMSRMTSVRRTVLLTLLQRKPVTTLTAPNGRHLNGLK